MTAERDGALGHVLRTVEIIEREGLEGLDIHYDELCDPNFEWHPTMVGDPGEVYVGREGYRRYLEELITSVTDVSFRVEDVGEAAEGRVLVTGYLALGRDGSALTESEYALLCDVDGDRLVSCTAFASHAAAREAARA
jgi:ketosteroid isomerase-like protein